MISRSTILTTSQLTHEDRIAIVRQHFLEKGYRVHSGLQFGCELVLYADHPGRVHSDFCVHIVGDEGRVDWRTMQTLVRSMPDLHKTLIIAYVVEILDNNSVGSFTEVPHNDTDEVKPFTRKYNVEEIAIATEHAPFRHRNAIKEVGMQKK
mmetsp:Transcript_37389/g.44607  ORF Transcript_37389/g.44607 Transcript_37389/m.44607 type:complete len:151 (+) Transcript_37389:60-512(+)